MRKSDRILRELTGGDFQHDRKLNLLSASRKGVRPKRVVVVDPSWKDFQGHHAEYDLAVSRGLLAQKIKSVILCHRDCLIRKKETKRIVPIFSKTMWEFGEKSLQATTILTKIIIGSIYVLAKISKFAGLIIPEIFWKPMLWKHFIPKALKINFARPEDLDWAQSLFWVGALKILSLIPMGLFEKELLQGLRKIDLQANDQVFFHMVIGPIFLPVLLGSYRAFEKTSVPPVVLLRYPPSFFKKSCLMQRIAWKAAEFLSEKGYIRLASDSHRLIQDFAEISHAPFEMFPLPHGRATRKDTTALRKDLRIGYLGDARKEKGFNELVKIVGEYTKKKQPGLRFCIQVFSPDAQCIESAKAIKQMAQNSGCIELYESALSPRDYLNLLQSLDVVVALYDPEIYQSRTSGICLDGWSAGKWVISTANTWAQDLAEAMGLSGEFCATQSAEELKAAIERLLRGNKHAKFSPQLKAFHNEGSFVDHLLGKKVSSLVASKGLIFYPWEDYRISAAGAGWVNRVFARAFQKKYRNTTFVSDGPLSKENWQMRQGFPCGSLLKKAVTLACAPKNPEKELLARFKAKLTRDQKDFFNKYLTQAAACLIHYPFVHKSLEPWLRRKPLKTLTVHHDLLYKKAKTSRLRNFFFQKTKEACKASDQNVFISRDELKEFKKEVGPRVRNLREVAVSSLIIKEIRASRRSPSISRSGIKIKPFCVYFGSDVPENREALGYFHLAFERSMLAGLNLDFRVLGGVAKAAKKDYPALDSRTNLADMEFRQMISDSAFCYFPMLSGTGISIKTIEAIAHKKVVVGTASAFRGIEKELLRNTFQVNNPRNPPLAVFREILERSSRCVK